MNFDDDRDGWFTSMEQKFVESSVSPERYTSYAIREGLKSSPDLQSVMIDRFDQYKRLTGQVASTDEFVFVDSSLGWPWEEFKDDISRVSGLFSTSLPTLIIRLSILNLC